MTRTSSPRLVDHMGRPLATTAELAAIRNANAKLATLSARYDAAATTAENVRHWRHADALSAAAANSLSVRKTLRERSRYECLENNSWGKGIATTVAGDFVARGPVLQLLIDDAATKRQIETAWRRWAKAVRLNRSLRTARLAKLIDGEAFLLLTTNRRIPGPIKLDVRPVESDQISTPGWIDGLSEDAVDGIAFDEDGNPDTYHLLNRHPGDRGLVNTIGNAHEKTDVSADYVIHLFNADRPGQRRGIPETTPALPLFAMLRRFTLATLQAAETAAAFSAVLKTQANAFGDEEGTLFDPFDGIPIDRGMMAALPYGYELQQFKAEHPTTTYREFRDALLLEIARCLHVPQYKALGSAAGYNFSSARMDDQDYEDRLTFERADWEPDCMDRVFAAWLDEAILAGELPGLGQYADEVPHRWAWTPRRSVNPLQDAHRVTHLIEAGLLTEEEYFASQAIDAEAHYAQLDRQLARRADRAAALAPVTPATIAARRKPSGDTRLLERGFHLAPLAPSTPATIAARRKPSGDTRLHVAGLLERSDAADRIGQRPNVDDIPTAPGTV
jgi:lambda family phage portal protein